MNFSLIYVQLLCLSDGLVLRTASIDELLERRAFPEGSTSTQALNQDRPTNNIVRFPVYTVAMLLFENYLSSVDHMCGILHIPTIRAQLKTVYLGITQSEPVCIGQAALLLSLLALSAFFYKPTENSEVAQSTRDVIDL